MKFILTIYKFHINGLNYIGSSWDYDNRKIYHKRDCYNENSSKYYYEIYKYIRDNNIDWDDITIEDIYNKELDEKNNLLRRQTEQKYIDEFDSKNNGLNTINAYITEEERKEQIKEYNKKYKKNHKEQLKEYNKEYNKKYKKNNKEQLKEYHKKYREHKRNEKMCGEIVNELINSLF